MAMSVKHGAMWHQDHAEGVIVFERHDPVADRLGVVLRRRDGLYKAVVFFKVNDPQWTLPFWAEAHPDAVIASEQDAMQHVVKLLELA